MELLLTLPITPWQAILGKFLASWLFLAIALGLSFPVWITVNYLGSPDNGVIFAGYVGSLMLAGAYLALTCITSALTRNQVISFILSVVICLLLIFAGGHSFNLAINLVGAYVHASRLQYVEFFSKFYEGGGRPFRPFALSLRYTRLEKED